MPGRARKLSKRDTTAGILQGLTNSTANVSAGNKRACLTLVFDRFLSHAPVPYAFLAPTRYYRALRDVPEKMGGLMRI